MKQLIVALGLILTLNFLAASANFVMAEEQTNCVQVTQYGGAVGIVCGVEHKPVETGLADINPVILASVFFGLAGLTFSKYKKLVRSEVGL